MFRHVFQLVQDGRWTDIVTSKLSRWTLPTGACSGCDEIGWETELRTEGGVVIYEDRDVFNRWASSGDPDGISLLERCEIYADSKQGFVNTVVATSRATCEVATIGMPDEVKVELGAEGGVNTELLKMIGLDLRGSAQASKQQDICDYLEKAGEAGADAGRQVLVNDCINNKTNIFQASIHLSKGQ